MDRSIEPISCVTNSQVPMSASPATLSSQVEGREEGDGKSACKRKAVRRDPEKRRQQNIQAQKKYREKLKKRLDQLETLEAFIAEGGGARQASSPDSSTSEARTPQSGFSNGTGSELCSSSWDRRPSLNTSSGGTPIDLPDVNIAESTLSALSPDVTLGDPISPSDSTIFAHNDTLLGSQQCITHVECGCPQPHVLVSPSIPKQYRDLRGQKGGLTGLSADPYANTLRVDRICIIQAIWANCLHIGITEEMLCDDDAISPFFRPTGKRGSNLATDGVVSSTQSIFRSLKPDVRPTREQISTAHHPMVDVLPFPTLRRNLIANGGALIDDELYDDLLNGLVCWGGTGVGQKDRNCSTGRTSTGTPWDYRSWEARPWFLQKYWASLGGEDGELVRQSEWWRSMRGDESDVWSKLLFT